MFCWEKCAYWPRAGWETLQLCYSFMSHVVAASGNAAAAGLASQLMQNPEVLAALQGKMDGMIGAPSGYIQR